MWEKTNTFLGLPTPIVPKLTVSFSARLDKSVCAEPLWPPAGSLTCLVPFPGDLVLPAAVWGAEPIHQHTGRGSAWGQSLLHHYVS